MRKILYVYIAIWVVLILLSPNPPAALANNPTVTVTKAVTPRAITYTYTYSTNISLADTAFLFTDASSWLAIDGVGAHEADSLITIECYSSETTADSVHHSIIYQVSSASAPSTTAGLSPSSGWVTAFVDSTSFHSKVPGSNPTVSKFPKLRFAGQATKMRILIAEMQTGAYTAKDANQNITLRVNIPRR